MQQIWAEVPQYRVLFTRFAVDLPHDDEQQHMISTVQVKGKSMGDVEIVEVLDWNPPQPQ